MDDGLVRCWAQLRVRRALHGADGPFDLDVALDVERGAFIALTGPSGAGKTTLLRLLAGLVLPDAGRVRVGDTVWCDVERRIAVPVQRRSIGFVFQDYALFPNMSVRGNVEYALRQRNRRNAGVEALRLLELVGLQQLAAVPPARLSGGQRQRLALIRALARRPELLLLDEPLSGLDPELRRQLQDELRRLHDRFGTTTVLVSHDPGEVLRLCDRVLRLQRGRIVLDGLPGEVLGAGSAAGLRVLGRHVSGPDADGLSTVMVDGRAVRIRYRPGQPFPAAGDAVILNVDEAAPWPVRA